MARAIQDNNLLYNILSPLVQFGCRCHYNSFVVKGKENLPKEGGYIIAPCHQQALMEPLAVLCFAPKPPVFLARADIFAKPTLRAILTFLRILPVYRIRDGQKNLGKNQAIFDQSRDVLVDGYPLCLMAEGRHNNRHHLLKMGKGMFRIAGEAQLRMGEQPLYIVPTGIDFDDYERPYSNVVVNIGKPIAVQPFMEKYKEDEPVALNEMREALTKALSPLMHDVRDEEHYDEIMHLCKTMNREMREREGLRNTAWNRFLMRQKITRDYESGILRTPPSPPQGGTGHTPQSLSDSSPKLGDQLRMHEEIGDIIVGAVALTICLLLMALGPVVRWVVLFCLVCYPLPFIPTHLIVKKKIADPQFRSSVNWGVRFFLSILYAIVIGIVMACCDGAWMKNVADIGAWWGLVAVAWVHIAARLTAPTVNLLRFFSCADTINDNA